jgi:diacylglycerol kinase family enzyme
MSKTRNNLLALGAVLSLSSYFFYQQRTASPANAAVAPKPKDDETTLGSSTGTVRGNSVEIRYFRDASGKRWLAWSSIWEEGDKDGKIAAKDVIAVIHGTWEEEETSQLKPADVKGLPLKVLYVDHSESGALSLKTLTATSLPAEFQAEYLVEDLPSYLLLPPKEKGVPQDVHIIVSTLSGVGKATSFFDDVVEPAVKAISPNTKYTLHRTTSTESVKEVTRIHLLPQAQRGIAQTVILLSGDGGIVDILNEILSPTSPAAIAEASVASSFKRPTIALIALGTGNALAHSLRVMPSDEELDGTLGLSTLFKGTSQPLPAFATTFSPGAVILTHETQKEEQIPQNTVYGAVVASWGFHASLVADSDTAEYRQHGVERFGMAAKEALWPSSGLGPHTYKGKVTLFNGEVTSVVGSGEHLYVLCTLVSNLERLFTISPESTPLKGALRLVRFGPLSAERVMEVMGKAYQGGKHVEEKEVLYAELEGLKIEFEEPGTDGNWRRICVDGKIVKVEEGGWVEVRLLKDEARGLDVVVREDVLT